MYSNFSQEEADAQQLAAQAQQDAAEEQQHSSTIQEETQERVSQLHEEAERELESKRPDALRIVQTTEEAQQKMLQEEAERYTQAVGPGEEYIHQRLQKQRDTQERVRNLQADIAKRKWQQSKQERANMQQNRYEW